MHGPTNMDSFWMVSIFLLSVLSLITAQEAESCPVLASDNQYHCQRFNSCVYCKDTVKNCFCDSLCHNYDDCCQDMIKNHMVLYQPPKESVDCINHYINGKLVPASIISRCPLNSTSEQHDKCSQYDGPLVYGGKSQLIYRNIFCSRCHEEETFEFVPFTLACVKDMSSANVTTELYEIFTYGKSAHICSASYGSTLTNKTVHYHPCLQNLISTCPSGTAVEIATNCMSGAMNAVYKFEGRSKYPAYRNEFCADCHNITSHICTPPAPMSSKWRVLTKNRGLDSLVDVMFSEELLDRVFNYDRVNNDKPHPTGNLSNATERNSSSNYQNDTSNAKGLLTIVLVVISLVSLLVQLVFYCYFKHLKNLPGLIIICLVTALFLALLFFLISLFISPNFNKVVCIAIAVLQHWAFLSSFFWTNVMAFDVTRMLQLSTTHQGNKKKKFALYSVYAWSFPTVLTTSALLADNLGWEIRPYYGSKICWINDRYGLITFFLGPLCVINLANITLYVTSIATIIHSLRQTRMVQPGLKDRLILSIRLIFIMGLPWILSVVSAFTRSDIADYLFIVLNALQGFFVLASFVVNKTFVKICKAEMNKSTGTESIKTTSSTISRYKSEQTSHLLRKNQKTSCGSYAERELERLTSSN